MKLTPIYLVFIFALAVFPQQSVSYLGLNNISYKDYFMLSTYENNKAFCNKLKDWEITSVLGGEFSDNFYSNLYLLEINKRLGKFSFGLRYTPGFIQEFNISNSNSIIIDSVNQNINSSLSYKDILGARFSYQISKNFFAGFTLNYINQSFSNDNFKPVFGDTIYIIKQTMQEKENFWKGDIGFSYQPAQNLMLSFSTINLFTLLENNFSDENKIYSIKKDKGISLGAFYNIWENTSFNMLYETPGNIFSGVGYNFDLLNGLTNLNFSAFHRQDEKIFVAGIIPEISYINKNFSVSMSYIKFLKEKDNKTTLQALVSKPVSNILNNPYSNNKLFLSLTLNLNTNYTPKVKFISVDNIENIYPVMFDKYEDMPVAKVKVVNLLNEPVELKSFSRIKGLTGNENYNPVVTLKPSDTSEVYFYTIIPADYSNKKSYLSDIDLYLNTGSEENDDHIQQPVLINGSNQWNGRVKDLNYFVKKNYNLSMNTSKNILTGHKEVLDTLSIEPDFIKAKLIFDAVIKNLVYVSDPRASSDYVQYPNETIELKGGDCDDFSVLFAALFESAGIETMFIDYKEEPINHVAILFNTKLKPGYAQFITSNDRKYFIRQNQSGEDEIWIPLETTSLKSFDEAWSLGASEFYEKAVEEQGLNNENVSLVDID